MADIKISQLPPDSYENLSDDDVLPIVNQTAGQTQKISLFELDKRWRALPSGGTVNQVLAKLTNVDGAVQWLTITKSLVGLSQVNNTADIDKPLSNAAISALNDKASKTSVNLKADTSYVNTELAKKIDKPLTMGADGQVLTLVAGVPSWENGGGTSYDLVKYFGDPMTNGSWRQRVDAAQFLTEVRVSGSWVIVSELNIP